MKAKPLQALHIAATTAGGAGIGLMRYHQALLAAETESHVLLPEAACRESQLPADAKSSFDWRPAPRWKRALARLGPAFAPSAMRFQHRLEEVCARFPQSRYELFSLPFSGFRPEDHPRTQAADVVVLHWVAGVVDWPRFFSRLRKPTVIVLHDQNPYLGGFHYQWDADRNPGFAALEADLTRVKADSLRGHRIQVVANSDWNAQQARQSGFFPDDVRIETVHYPLDTSIHHPGARTRLPALADSPPDQFVIGFACENLNNDRKGLADLLAALQTLTDDERSRLSLLSFGRDPDESIVRQIPIPWHHAGSLVSETEKVAAYRSMDLFVAPSRAEAFGLTALEAQACGTAVVAAPIEGLLEAVAANPVPDGDPESRVERLAAGIRRFLHNASERNAAAEAGLRLVRNRHDPARIGEQFRTCLERHARP